MSVFVDTGVLVGAAMRKDARHRQATALLRRLASENTTTTTTDHVVVETWAILRSRLGYRAAMTFWHGLRATPLRPEAVTVSDLERAQAIADQWSDQEFDLVDCTSFAVMERLGTTRAASFDPDFAIYRFGAERKRSFEIVA